jgi:hypothetical protein
LWRLARLSVSDARHLHSWENAHDAASIELGRAEPRHLPIAVLAVQSWRRVRNGWLRHGPSLASMRPVAIATVAPLTLGSVGAVGHELGSAGRPPEVGSSIDGSRAIYIKPKPGFQRSLLYAAIFSLCRLRKSQPDPCRCCPFTALSRDRPDVCR